MRAESMRSRHVVAVLIKGLGLGGAERLISEGARYWDRSSFDYRVAYLLPWKSHLVADLEAQDIPVHCLGNDPGTALLSPLRLRRLLREWNTSLVHAHLPWPGIVARIFSSYPVVYTEHNLVTSYRPLTRWANRVTYGRNRALTAVSEAVAEAVAGYPGPEPVVIPNGVAVSPDDSAARAARRELGLGEDQLLVVHVGNIRPGKGHELLIETAIQVVAQQPDVTIVSIGGEKTPGRLQELRETARRRGLNGVIRFLGERHDARSFIAASDVYVNPAAVEGLPVSILEAMALGRPVVATAVGGVPSLLEGSGGGLVVPSESPDQLARGILGLLADPLSRQRMGEAGAAAIAENYSLETMVRGFEAIYRRILV